MSASELNDTPTAAAIGMADFADTPTRMIADLVEQVGYLNKITRIQVDDSSQLHSDSKQLHGQTLEQLLRTVTGDLTKGHLDQLLGRLGDKGFAWRDLARIIGVSVPAIRKWRQGEQATGENRRRVAEIVAFCIIVKDKYLIDDVASWLEVPLVQSAPVTGLDLLAACRFDLLFQWAADLRADPEELLDEYMPDWRTAYAADVDVFLASDGQKGLRLRD